jgi:hypothetical protein
LQLRLLLMAAKILKSVEVVAAGGQPYQDPLKLSSQTCALELIVNQETINSHL